MKLVTVLGARPQFIKAASVSRALQQEKQIQEIIIHTGQHFDKNMSHIFFEEMRIPVPKYNLDINSLTHGAMTGRMLEKIEEIILQEKPDIVLVYGDTNSTLAGALAAKKQHIKVAHVEAGLRSFNMSMPEEINRILTDRISDFLFCPTDTAVRNLKSEGFDNFQSKIIKTGDVMQDSALFYANFAKKTFKEIPDRYVLATLHRAENTDNVARLMNIFTALTEIAKHTSVVMPLHPRTKHIILENHIPTAGIKLIEPVGYLEMVNLLSNCNIVMTDSGGIQKEAFFFKKNCITLRDETEWVELVTNGFNILAGANVRTILESYNDMINKQINFEVDLYGNGTASEKIAQILVKL